jgi:phosphonopyruvate decarboxylase
MLSTPKCLAYLVENGLGPFVGVPCSFLKPFINYVIDSSASEYIAANNEGEAVAIAAGAWLAGRNPVAMFQNSGLGNAVNPLTSLHYVFRIPLLLITTWRGEPGHKDEPQHRLMGEITPSLLDCLRIPHALFPEEDDQLAPRMAEAMRALETSRLPYAFIVRKGAISEYDLQSANEGGGRRNPLGRVLPPEPASGVLMLRSEAVAVIADAVDPSSLLIATTGGTARELFTLRDRAANLYVVGSMGCASSVALGVALYAKDRPVVVLDGDGAALMRLEAMVSIGHYQPANYIHVVLDNEVYDSTGGQRTLSDGVDFPGLALACGYETAASATSAKGLAQFLEAARANPGPHLIHVRIRPGSHPGLGRPTLTPPEVAARFRQEILGRELGEGTA